MTKNVKKMAVLLLIVFVVTWKTYEAIGTRYAPNFMWPEGGSPNNCECQIQPVGHTQEVATKDEANDLVVTLKKEPLNFDFKIIKRNDEEVK